MSEAGAATPRMSRQDQEYELAKMRIINSSQYVGRMIWVISLIAGLISVLVVLSVVLIALVGIFYGVPAQIPDVLSNWGGIILGFYFGQFVSLVKDFMGIVSGASTQQQTQLKAEEAMAPGPSPSPPS